MVKRFIQGRCCCRLAVDIESVVLFSIATAERLEAWRDQLANSAAGGRQHKELGQVKCRCTPGENFDW